MCILMFESQVCWLSFAFIFYYKFYNNNTIVHGTGALSLLQNVAISLHLFIILFCFVFQKIISIWTPVQGGFFPPCIKRLETGVPLLSALTQQHRQKKHTAKDKQDGYS